MHVIMQPGVVFGGHTHRFVVQAATVYRRHVRRALQVRLGTAAEGTRQEVRGFVHVDPGAIERDQFMEVFQHQCPVVDGVGMREVWPDCRMTIPNLVFGKHVKRRLVDAIMAENIIHIRQPCNGLNLVLTI